MESSKKSYRFGPYQVNARECVLLRDGQPVPLTPKAFDTLLALVSNGGHLVEKVELMNQVWPETSVEESNLTQNIFTLRRVLGEGDGKSKYIETVPRRGYRFVASVTEVLELDVSAKPQETNQRFESVGNTSETQTGSLAVLPFVNASDDERMECLADGITESIIKRISQLPQLRVMSRNTVFRYKNADLDARQIGQELGVDAVLVGSIRSRQDLVISSELVEVVNGWQLWGESYDRESGSLLDVQEEIANQISAALRVKLTGYEEKKVTRRYTESSNAYNAYKEGRHHWRKYTAHGLWDAITSFQRAIEIDPTYALAYAGVVDCYLRLATNYLPPHDDFADFVSLPYRLSTEDIQNHASVKLRCQWDQKTAERELQRAAELKSNYPATHQWYTASQFALNLCFEAQMASGEGQLRSRIERTQDSQYRLTTLTQAEEIQIFCAIAREQLDVGNYEAGCLVLSRRWKFGSWPLLDGLGAESSADLLFTSGALAGHVASTRQVPRGQKHAQALLNGSVALCEQLGSKIRSAEGRIELGYCYYREGLFDVARETLQSALEDLPYDEKELIGLALVRLAMIEHNSGCLHDAWERLNQAAPIARVTGPWISGRYHLETATTLEELAVAENYRECFESALDHYKESLYEFEAVGDHRYAAIVANNQGYLLLNLKRFVEAEGHLQKARKLFEVLGDRRKKAQVEESLTQLYLNDNRIDLAEQTIQRAIATLEDGDEDAVLVELLTTRGRVLCHLNRLGEAKRVLNRAHEVGVRCGDREGAGRALLILIEQMCEQLDDDERLEIGRQLQKLLANSQNAATRERLRKCLKLLVEMRGR